MKNSNNPSVQPAPTPAPATDNFSSGWLNAFGPNANAASEWLKTNNPPNLATLMDIYKVLVLQFMRDNGSKEDCIRQVTPMLRAITTYEQNLARQNHRERTLKLNESKQEMKAAKAGQKQAAQKKADRKEAEESQANRDIQASHLAERNKFSGKDVDTLKEHSDVVMPDNKNPIGRLYENIPEINPPGLPVTPREPAMKNQHAHSENSVPPLPALTSIELMEREKKFGGL